MRGDKFAPKRSRAYRQERKVEVAAVILPPDLLSCIRGFMQAAHFQSEEEAITLLLMAGLGLSLSGPERLDAALTAFVSSHN